MRKFLDAQSTVFEPEVIEILSAALDAVWADVQAGGTPGNGYDATSRDILAKRILETAKKGERDPARLKQDALAHFEKTVKARARR